MAVHSVKIPYFEYPETDQHDYDKAIRKLVEVVKDVLSECARVENPAQTEQV